MLGIKSISDSIFLNPRNMGNINCIPARPRHQNPEVSVPATPRCQTPEISVPAAAHHQPLEISVPAIPRRHISTRFFFRVLIIGRANAGKTSILQRICDTTESPAITRIIYNEYKGYELGTVSIPTFLWQRHWSHPPPPKGSTGPIHEC